MKAGGLHRGTIFYSSAMCCLVFEGFACHSLHGREDVAFSDLLNKAYLLLGSELELDQAIAWPPDLAPAQCVR